MPKATDKEAKRLLAVLYFSRNCGSEYKELAKRIRAEGSRTVLVWSNLFKGPENLIEEARAVIIHKNSRAARIAAAYSALGHDVEIHYADDDGEFIDDECVPDPADDEEAEIAEGAVTQESVSADAVVQDGEAEQSDDDVSDVSDEQELDTRSDEKFFSDAAEDDEDAADESGTSGGESEG